MARKTPTDIADIITKVAEVAIIIVPIAKKIFEQMSKPKPGERKKSAGRDSSTRKTSKARG